MEKDTSADDLTLIAFAPREPEVWVQFADVRKIRNIAQRALDLGFYFNLAEFTFGELQVFTKIVSKLSLEDALFLASVAARQDKQLWAGASRLHIEADSIAGIPAVCSADWVIDPGSIDPGTQVRDILLPWEDHGIIPVKH